MIFVKKDDKSGLVLVCLLVFTQVITIIHLLF